MTCERVALSHGIDRLAISLHLAKGDRSALTIRSAQYLVSSLDGLVSPLDRKELGRGKFRGIKRFQTGNLGIEWNAIDSEHPNLNLTPGETTHLLAICDVPHDTDCEIEVAVQGTRPGKDDKAQWQAGCMSWRISTSPIKNDQPRV